METPTIPEFLIGQMRVVCTRQETFFHVAGRPTPMAKLDEELDRLIPLIEAAQDAAGIAQVGPLITRYYWVSEPDTYIMELGVPVRPDTPAAGEAQVKTLSPIRCASLLFWGSLEHIGPAYEALMTAIKEAGLEPSGDNREWHYHFEGDSSPNNIIGLQIGIR
ncbi:MAG: GyrI-like domain-containing protein [Anaerolineae bacterium]|nr:GyrI-like domain-containing protein [Anaerolineae bacterium]